MAIEQSTKTIEISLNTLRVLLFGDERLEEIKPYSRSIGDTAKVKVVPHAIGIIIASIDKEEDYFHVEIPEARTHAEIWLSFEWRESNTRRSRQQLASSERRITHEKNSSRMKEIIEKLSPMFSKHPGYAEQLAMDILKNYRNGDFGQTLRVLNLAETLAKYEEEDKQ